MPAQAAGLHLLMRRAPVLRRRPTAVLPVRENAKLQRAQAPPRRTLRLLLRLLLLLPLQAALPLPLRLAPTGKVPRQSALRPLLLPPG